MSTGTHLTNVATIRRVAAIHTVTTIKDKMAHVENDYPMVEDSHANNDKFVKAGSGESGPTDAGKAVLISKFLRIPLESESDIILQL